jgi:hypothetical protein
MNLAQKVERDQKRCAEVVDGCTRAERNSAIDETRTRLTEAVGALHAD